MTAEIGHKVEIPNYYFPSDLALRGRVDLPIVIPTHNNSAGLVKVIANIQKQEIPSNVFMRLVVDANACVDDTADVARKSLAKLEESRPGIKTKLIVTPIPGEPQALNSMVDYLVCDGGSSPEFVVGINDDVILSRGTLATLCGAMLDFPNLGAIGVINKTIPKVEDSSRPWQVANLLTYDLKKSPQMVTGRAYGFRPSVIGKFPNIMSEDGHMTICAIKESEGFGILTAPGVFIYIYEPSTWFDVVRQRVTHSLATSQLVRHYPDYFGLKDQANGSTVDKGHNKRLFDRAVSYLSDERFGLDLRVMSLLVAGASKVIARIIDRYNRPDSSSRVRVKTAQ